MSTPDDDDLEAKLRALAREIGGSIERAVEDLDLDELNERVEELRGSLDRVADQLDLEHLTERIGMTDERARELAELAGQWLSQQFGVTRSPWAPEHPDPSDGPTDHPHQLDASAPRVARRPGPHPLDVPNEQQGLALSALDSGRWRVEPGSDELIPVGGGPVPEQRVGLVGELRARDWISPNGQLTLVGRDALARWLGRDAG
jgi:uncharacterized coiled-coil protein SlyX